MPTAPHTAPKSPPQSRTHDRFEVGKATFGGITQLTLAGTLDHAFEGKKVADAISTRKLVLVMREVRRFASWGMSEWMDFLRINESRDLYLVECSTYAVSQLNLVTGLLGHAKLVSFYASYRCGSCSEQLETLFLIPRDRELIRELPGSDQECPTCGGRARLEEYPAAFFDTIADRAAFDVDDEVLGYLRSQFKYNLSPDLTRFRAHRRSKKDYTYLRLSGSLAMLQPDALAQATEDTAVLDLERVVFDPTQMMGWRKYLLAARQKARSIQLWNCPPGFLEHGLDSEDLRDKVKVRTFAQAYECARCNAPTLQMIDVATHLEQLVSGILPPATCATCQGQLIAGVHPEQMRILRALPARDRDAALDRFLDKARTEPNDSLENYLVASPRKEVLTPTGSSRAMFLALGLTMLVIVGLGVVAFTLWKDRDDRPAAPTPAVIIPPQAPKFERPDWILSDVPSSAYCHDMINRLMCVGVSAYRPTRDEAVSEANNAALEELVNTVGLKISDSYFRAAIMPAYSEVRAKALSALQSADLDRSSAAYLAANKALDEGRKRVTEILQISGGAAVPNQRTDWYWEEYAAKKGGTEVLVFVRYDVSLDAVKALTQKYSSTTSILGSPAMTGFPALAWAYPEFAGGVQLTKVGAPLKKAGVSAQDMIVALGEQRVADVTGLARRLEEWKLLTTDLELSIQSEKKPGVVETRKIEIPRRQVR